MKPMVNKVFYFLKSYFGFSRREARGFVFVIPVLILLYAFPYWVSAYYRASSEESYSSYLEKFRMLKEDSAFSSKKPLEANAGTTMLQEKENKEAKKQGNSLRAPERPGLNTIAFSKTTAVELQLVNGVGPVLSERIVAFRSKLGGFNRAEQLLEVYGVDAALAEKIFATFPFSPNITSKIDINAATVQELSQHPYIAFGEAKVIVAYRKQHGAYKMASDLLHIRIFSEDWVDRIAPYLNF
ncbi:ComEA family DNA-binding protein [Cyclobacterium plantarum]|uniref:ComEA family DNA-binding protein n=1 Tax=Cyclobacterium plantarum TaxID=2716263 RepID=UPI003F71D48D